MNNLCLRFALIIGTVATLSFSSASGQPPYQWVPTAAGTYNWDAEANWTGNLGGFPSTANIQANLTTNIVGDQTIQTSGALGTIRINRLDIGDASNAYTVRFNGGTTLTFDVGFPATTGPFLNMTAGSTNQIIDTPIVIAVSPLTITQSSTSGSLLISQAISGAASLTKAGAGEVILSGTNTYSTGTTISAGTLRIGNGGTTGSVSGNITNNAALIFDRSNDLTYGGVVSGTGSLTKQGAGTLSLTGANTYTGGTTVSAGTLSIGNGGATGAVAGNITNNSVVAFNRSDAVIYGDIISGTGAVTKLGANTLTFTSNQTYTGDTTVSAGTLQFGNASAAGSVAGNIVNNSAVVFNRTDPVTYAGNISGTGTLTKLGSDSLTLSGTTTYTGATTVTDGTLRLESTALTSSSSKITVGFSGQLQAVGAYVVGSPASPNQRLEGNGTVSATTLTIQGIGSDAGVIAPGVQGGQTVDILNVQAKAIFAPGGVYEVSYNKLNGEFTQGTDNDLIFSSNAADTLDVTATSADRFRIRMNYTGTEQHNVTGDKELMIAAFAGGITNFSQDKFVLEGDIGQPETFILELRNNGTELWLTFSPVPEPTTVLGIATVGLVGVGYLRRRRRK